MMIVRTIGKYDLVYSPDYAGYYWHDTEEDAVTRTLAFIELQEPVDFFTFR